MSARRKPETIELSYGEAKRLRVSLYALARAHGGTLERLAPHVQISAQTLSVLSRGGASVRSTRPTLAKIAALAGCSVEDLLAGRGPR